MTHLWIRAEQRAHEDRVGLTPQGAAILLSKGFQITVEESPRRIIPIADYQEVGCEIAPEGSWPTAPKDAIVFGLKELPEDGSSLKHRHIMFGHAFKGQHSGQQLLKRFKAGGGQLLDLEYLTDDSGRRVAAFGYWAGFAGAAVSLFGWIAQQHGALCGPVKAYPQKDTLLDALNTQLAKLGPVRPNAIVIGAKGRVGTGAKDLLGDMGCRVTEWDMAETAHGGPFPEILAHDLFINCILAWPGTPVFVPKSSVSADRKLRVIGDVACDPDSDYNPIPLYHQATDWDAPILRVSEDPQLDVMAIDNLPSMLPLESSIDFAEQLLPTLEALDDAENDTIWQRAKAEFERHAALI